MSRKRFDFGRFVPRVVRAEEATELRGGDLASSDDMTVEQELSDDLELPDDLALLAEQLGADAEYLAARYPADATDRAVRPRVARVAGSRLRMVWSSAAAILLVATGIWSGSRLVETEQPAPLASVVAPSSGQATLTVDVAPPADFPATPAMYFQDLSGPEQEGLLDLFEEESLPQSSLSI
jgi:hypothetical protein